MAWTAPVTHATGDVLPASDWNTDVRDDLNYLHGDAGNVDFTAGGASYSFTSVLGKGIAGASPIQAFVTGEANPRVALTSSSTASLMFGPGGAGALDTQLYRNAAGVLRTPGSLIVDGVASGAGVAGASPLQVFVTGEANPRAALSSLNTASLQLGPGGGAALDTQLYRGSAGVLRTPGNLTVDGASTLTGALALGSIVYESYASLTTAAGVTVTPDSTIGGAVQRYNITSVGTVTIAAPTLTPAAGQSRFLTIIIHNASGGAITLAWNAVYQGFFGSPANGTGTIGLFIYSPATAKWSMLQSATE